MTAYSNAFGMKCKLAVTAALYLPMALIMLSAAVRSIWYSLSARVTAGAITIGVAGVYAYRIEVFHGADSNDVPGAVTHHLKLDFFPAGDTLSPPRTCVIGESSKPVQRQSLVSSFLRHPRCRRRNLPGCKCRAHNYRVGDLSSANVRADCYGRLPRVRESQAARSLAWCP